MAETVGQHSVAAFTSPVNGTSPIDANGVRGNDNTVRAAYVDHDADPGIHVQSSSYASRPVAGTVGRKWITINSGRYQLWYDDGSRWHEVASDAINVDCLADANLTKGDVVKVTGFNNGQNLPTVNKVSSSADTAFGIVENTTTSGNIVQIVNTGIIEDVNTSAFSINDIVYPNSSGGLTATKPVSGNYQPAGLVLRSNASNGVLYVEFSALRIVERSDNTVSTIVLRDASGNFAAGTITAGAVTASGAVSAGSVTSTGLVTFASLKGTGATTVTDILNDGTMATASATTLATSASIKTYVDSQVDTVDTLDEVLTNGNTTGTNDIIVNAGQKIRTPLVAAQDGTSAITIANSTGALTLNTALADSNLATISTAGKVANSATTATSSNTASAIVARDASGNFSAGTITATLSGAAPAGSLSGTTLASNVVSSSLTSVGTLANLTVTNPITGSVTGSSGSTTGNAATATALQTARNINGVSFNGTADITVTAAAGTLTGTTLASGVTASSLTSVGTLTSLTVSGTTSLQSQTTMSRQAGAAVNLLFGLRSSVADIATDTAGTIRFLNAAQAAVNMSIADAGDVVIRNNLTVDTNTLYVDAANNRVGVGTASPSATLDVNGGNIRTSSGSGTTFVQIDDSSTGGRTYTLISAGAGNVHSVAAGSFYLRDSSSSATRFLIDPSGNLGLGVTPSAWSGILAIQNRFSSFCSYFDGSPAVSTQVVSNAFYDGSAWKYQQSLGAAIYEQTTASGGVHTWSTAASGTGGNTVTFTERARITSGGYFKASSNGTYVSSTGLYHELRSADNAAGLVVTNTSTSYTDDLIYGNVTTAAGTGFKLMRLDSNSVEQFRVRGDGTIFAQNTTVQSLSDVRLKENISDAAEGLAVITALRPVRYDWKAGYGNDRKNQLGFVAQEMEAVFPEAVSVWEMDEPTGEVDEDGKPITEKVDYKTVGPGALIPVLVKAIQELEARIAVLEAGA